MRTALFTVSFNRPDLMEELLQGLSANMEDLDGIDVFHFVDGGPRAKPVSYTHLRAHET